MNYILDKMLNDSIKEEDYDFDYKLKCENPNYKQFLNSCSQLSIDSFQKFCKSYEYELVTEIENIKNQFLYDSDTHGIKHNIRVLLFGFYLSKKLNLDKIDAQIIKDACKYHDVGRLNDLYDEKHGLRSSKMVDNIVDNEIYQDEENLNLLRAIIEYHSIPDREIDKIFRKYKLKDEKRYKILAAILKDADGLDRVRLSINGRKFCDLNPKYLRLEDSLSLVKCSHIINCFDYKKTKKM